MTDPRPKISDLLIYRLRLRLGLFTGYAIRVYLSAMLAPPKESSGFLTDHEIFTTSLSTSKVEIDHRLRDWVIDARATKTRSPVPLLSQIWSTTPKNTSRRGGCPGLREAVYTAR